MPTTTGPSAGSQPSCTASPPRHGPMADLARPTAAPPRRRCGRSAGGRRRSARGCRVAAVVAADHEHQVERVRVEQRHAPRPGGPAWRCRSCRRPGSGRRAPARRTGRPSPAGTSPRSPATPTSASSSGWRGRCGRGRGRGRSPRDAASPKRARKASPVAAVPDVVADDVGFRAVQHDEVPAARLLAGLRGRRLRLLVVDLAVDDRREAVAGVLADVLPDVQHRPAGRVHQRAPLALQLREQAARSRRRRAG